MAEEQYFSDRLAKVLSTVLREMRAYGAGWRMDWSGFDGRTLRDQLGGLADWAEAMLKDNAEWQDYNEGTEFLKDDIISGI